MSTFKTLMALILLTSSLLQAQTMGKMTDPRDGQTYQTVSYENEILDAAVTWMAQNLNYKIEGSYAYDSNEKYRESLGLLYTWDAAFKACPKGWHLPSDEEWKSLINLFGSITKAGNALKSKQGWKENIDSDNKSKFNVIPSGFYYWWDESFIGLGENAVFWSSSFLNDNAVFAKSIMLYDTDSKVEIIKNSDKRHAMSCRCVKN